MPDTLVLLTYAPALERGDPRTLGVTRELERALPGLRLDWTLSNEGAVLPISQREHWLTQAAGNADYPMLCNGNEDALVTVFGMDSPAGTSPGGQPLFEVHAHLPVGMFTPPALANALEAVSEASQSYWGRIIPTGMSLAVSEQFQHQRDEPHTPPRGLPSLRLPWELRSPEFPHYLGWLNYWSAATAQALGFPDPSQDAELLSRSRRTASGGWLVPLTDTPLDLDAPAHLDALLRAYARFPAIGGRAPFAVAPPSR
jgi:hypothetical protein